MPAKKKTTIEVYDKIRADFIVLNEKKKLGVRLYHQEQIFARLAKKHYKSSKTIENIVFHRV